MKGGRQPGSGRPRGATTRLPADEVSAALDGLLLPGESDASLADRLGVARQTVSRARREGVSGVTLARWVLAGRR